jgi:hypothetical protein
MNQQAQDNIRQLLWDRMDENSIDPMDILTYADVEDEVVELIHETLGRLSNDDVAKAITRILARRQKNEILNACYDELSASISVEWLTKYDFDTRCSAVNHLSDSMQNGNLEQD